MSDSLPDQDREQRWARSLRDLLALNSRDWAHDRSDAWLWGIVWGWDGDDDETGAMDELAHRHGWDAIEVQRLRELHAGFVEAADTAEAAGLRERLTRAEALATAWAQVAESDPDEDTSQVIAACASDLRAALSADENGTRDE